mgnify:CR=1 FL=1
MIALPSRRKLQRQIEEEYAHLDRIYPYSVDQLEKSMRKIHILVYRMRSYGITQDENRFYFE